MSWRPFLPEPRPAVVDPDDPDLFQPIPLDVLGDLRDLCANFRIPPRRFRKRTSRQRKGRIGCYFPSSDIVAVDLCLANLDGRGGNEGYYAVLLHELLHATGHVSRLGRATITAELSTDAYALEEGITLEARRIVLAEIEFPTDAVDWYAPRDLSLPVDRWAAREAAAWILG